MTVKIHIQLEVDGSHDVTLLPSFGYANHRSSSSEAITNDPQLCSRHIIAESRSRCQYVAIADDAAKGHCQCSMNLMRLFQ